MLFWIYIIQCNNNNDKNIKVQENKTLKVWCLSGRYKWRVGGHVLQCTCGTWVTGQSGLVGGCSGQLRSPRLEVEGRRWECLSPAAGPSVALSCRGSHRRAKGGHYRDIKPMAVPLTPNLLH